MTMFTQLLLRNPLVLRDSGSAGAAKAATMLRASNYVGWNKHWILVHCT